MSNTKNIRTLNIVEEARKSALANIEQFQSVIAEAGKIHTEVIASSISKSQMETARAMIQPMIEAWQGFGKNNLFIQAIKRQQYIMKNLIVTINTHSLMFPPLPSDVVEGHIRLLPK